jgi:tetratricopeptide (TPR) repeat protein
MGELQTLARRVSDRLHDAIQRRDLFGMAACRSNMATMAWLVSGQAVEARRQLAEAISDWPGAAFQLPHYFALSSSLRIDLYVGDALAAWDRANREWKRLARSGLLQIRLMAADLISLRAACGLAVAAAGVSRRSPLRTVEDCARRLEKQRAPWTTALARLIRAGAFAVRGECYSAATCYRHAAESLESAQLPLYAAAARLRLGELLGDRALIADAESSFVRRGVTEPDRMAQLLAPNCQAPRMSG